MEQLGLWAAQDPQEAQGTSSSWRRKTLWPSSLEVQKPRGRARIWAALRGPGRREEGGSVTSLLSVGKSAPGPTQEHIAFPHPPVLAR